LAKANFSESAQLKVQASAQYPAVQSRTQKLLLQGIAESRGRSAYPNCFKE